LQIETKSKTKALKLIHKAIDDVVNQSAG
jgi:hypothetical protein